MAHKRRSRGFFGSSVAKVWFLLILTLASIWQPTPVFLPGESQGRGEPGGLPSMGSHRVRHDWSDLAVYLNIRHKIWLISCWRTNVNHLYHSFSRKPYNYFECVGESTLSSFHERVLIHYLIIYKFSHNPITYLWALLCVYVKYPVLNTYH